jgi:hypothetical protein
MEVGGTNTQMETMILILLSIFFCGIWANYDPKT